MSNWISVKDRLPEHEQDVLIATSEWVIMGMWKDHWGDNGAFSDSGDCGLFEQPAHWQPLPEPPKDGE